MIRRYSELIRLQTFEERFKYLELHGTVGESTFGFDRYLNQVLYHSYEWYQVRDEVIIRDNGCDLGIDGRDIFDRIIVHHMNPITEDEIIGRSPDLLNPDFLICTSLATHNAIHYGDGGLLKGLDTERRANDTSPWLL